MSKQFTAIGTIIDSSVEELVPYLQTLDFGLLTNIKKMLEVEYQKVETTKDALLAGLNTYDDAKKKQAEGNINQLYIALQRIEDKCTLLEQIKTEKVAES